MQYCFASAIFSKRMCEVALHHHHHPHHHSVVIIFKFISCIMAEFKLTWSRGK